MCGRYTLAIEYEELIEAFGVPFNPHLAEVYRPRYNIAPTDGVLILREKQHALELIPARFGLVNHWAKDLSGAARQLNARAETVREKPAFRDAFNSRRCVVPANGFYEWHGEGKTKVPFWLHPPNEKVLRFAGLYETWRDQVTGAAIRTFAIVTTVANEVVRPIHDRMPALLTKEGVDVWLNASPTEAFSLLQPAPNSMLEAQKASRRVGSVKNDDPGLLREEPAVDGDLPLFSNKK